MSGTTGRIGRMAGRLTLVALVVTTVLAGASMAGAQMAAPVIVTLRLDGVVDPFTADYITGNVQRAEDQGAEAVLLYMDTPGGLGSSMDQITESFLASKIPVIAYVSPSGARAASAGAFILLSAPVAAMAPGTHVGASTPIGLSGGDLDQKVKNDATAQIETLATTYGRNADVAATFVTQAASITADQALSDGVIDLIAPSTKDLLTTLNGTSVQLGDGTSVTLHTAGATLQDEKMGAFVGFLHSLFDPNLAFVFFWLGLALLVAGGVRHEAGHQRRGRRGSCSWSSIPACRCPRRGHHVQPVDRRPQGRSGGAGSQNSR
jgi:membrane-bound serine protease (ClpP class)